MKLGSIVGPAELHMPAKFGRDPASGYRVAMDWWFFASVPNGRPLDQTEF
jgi:hypothetical protein